MMVLEKRHATTLASMECMALGAKASIVLIDTRRAVELLELNEINRAVRQGKVDQLSEDMKEGLFKFTGDAIRIFHIVEEGTTYLIDGQHRLFAIIMSDVVTPMMLIEFSGTRQRMIETLRSIDKVAARSLGNDVTIERKIGADPYTKDLSDRSVTIAINALAYADLLIPTGSRNGSALSIPKKERYAIEHGRDVAAVALAASHYRQKRGSDPSIGWMTGFLLTWRKNQDEALRFWDAIAEGHGDLFFDNSPALAVREAMGTPMNKLWARYGTDSRIVLCAHCYIKYWNAHREGRTIKNFRFDKDFPDVLG